MKKIYLFLDFDGVLHGEGIDSKSQFEHVEDFCDMLLPYKNHVEIIIASSWRKTNDLNNLKTIFPISMREMIVAVTPSHVDEKSYAKGGRQREIEEYCLLNQINDNQWIALDDQKRLFDDECKNVLFTDSEIGLTEDNLLMLKQFFNQHINQLKTKNNL